MARERNELILADLVLARAERDPDLDVLTFEHLSLDDGATSDEVRTYADLAANANRLAAGLRARGVSRGDRVAVMLRNHPEFVETMIACSILGAVIVPIDPRTRGDKLVFMLRKAACVGVLCGDYCAEALASAREDAPDLRFAWGVPSGKTEALATVSGIEPVASATLRRPSIGRTTRITGRVWPMPERCHRCSSTSPARVDSGVMCIILDSSARFIDPNQDSARSMK